MRRGFASGTHPYANFRYSFLFLAELGTARIVIADDAIILKTRKRNFRKNPP